jgi:hypothetical protein
MTEHFVWQLELMLHGFDHTPHISAVFCHAPAACEPCVFDVRWNIVCARCDADDHITMLTKIVREVIAVRREERGLEARAATGKEVDDLSGCAVTASDDVHCERILFIEQLVLGPQPVGLFLAGRLAERTYGFERAGNARLHAVVLRGSTRGKRSAHQPRQTTEEVSACIELHHRTSEALDQMNNASVELG